MQNQIFSQKAAEFWQINGAFKSLHDINKVRVQFIERNANNYFAQLTGLSILDYGSGAGILAESLAKKSAQVLAIDSAKQVIAVAKEHAKKNKLKIKYQVKTAKQLVDAYKKNKLEKFDLITCLEVLEHVQDPEQLIEHLSSLVKKNGLIFFSTLNRNLKSFLGSILFAEYIAQFIPKGTHQYESFIKPSELDHICTKRQLQLIDISGINYNPITRIAKLSQDSSINYLVCYQKL